MHPHIHAETTPRHPALIVADSGETIDYAALDVRANRLAHSFRALGLENGDGLALICDNRPEFLDIYWAAQRSGLILVPVSTRLRAHEIAYIANDSASKALVISAPLGELALELDALRAEMPSVSTIATIGSIAGLIDLAALAAGQSSAPVADERIGGRMTYSSGTTGRPKGIRFAPAEGMPVQPNPGAMLFGRLYNLDATTTYLSPAPLYHSAPLGMTAGIQALGGTVVLMPKFDAEAFLAAIERWRVTAVQVVPTMFVRLLALPEATRLRYDLSSLKTVVHAAAPCPIPIKHAMIEWLGPIIEEYYGGSEGNGHVAISSAEWLARPGSVGRAVFGQIHVCDDDGRELPTGEIGTIYFGGGRSFDYHNDPSKTAASRNPLHPEWSTMGDVGRVDREGYLFLSDRKDFMIISGGVNIYPQEVEDLLITHPAIADAAVIGVPNHAFGEEVKAVIQPKDWAHATDDFAAELIDWCSQRLADVKCPRTIDFDPALPRTETGKLLKKEVKARYWPAG